MAARAKDSYPNTKKAIDIEDKVKIVVDDMMPCFELGEFKVRMDQPLVPKDAVTKHFPVFLDHRDNLLEKKKISIRTRDIDSALNSQLRYFFTANPDKNNIHLWSPEILDDFRTFMINETSEGGKNKLSETTAKIYLEAFRTFFNWAIAKEIIVKDIFRKYTIPKGNDSWYPYSYKELRIIFGVTPKTQAELEALRWTKLFVFSGGSDPMDFSDMKWRQVQTGAIQMMRVKSAKRSKAGKKLLYLSDFITDLFLEIKGKRGKPDEYVLPHFDKEKPDRDNLENHKNWMKLETSSLAKVFLKYEYFRGHNN